jgi:maltooligosyltrehalose trehalohydrolase
MYWFEIWAPLVEKIAVDVNGGRLRMQGPDEQGWWRLAVKEAGPGSDYGFSVNDEEGIYPDPRSVWQPNGVHGLSRVYDQDAYQWNDGSFQPPPLASAIVYELHVGTFTAGATLDAAMERLDHLKDLGVTHIELMPVASFAGVHGWGYDGVSLFAVHEPYGGPDALKRFVDAAHGKGLAVLLDVVYNHFGPSGNYTGKFGPYVIDKHHTPWGAAVNFEDRWSHQVRRFFGDNALMWMRDFHVDGLRLDAVHAYVDRSAVHFLEQLAQETQMLEATLARRKVLVAESDANDPRIVTAREGGGFGVDAQWSDDFHHALFAVLHPGAEGYYTDFGDLSQLAKALKETFVYDGIYSKYRNRMHGRSPRNLSQHRFFGYIQNHDQVGNRAVGERLQESVGLDRTLIAAAIVLTSPFIPMIFQGEEWAASAPFQYFADHDDEELARLVSEGRKKEFRAFGWNPETIPDPEKRETYTRSILNWEEMNEGEHARVLDWYRNLIHLRRFTPSLNNGDPANTVVSFDSEANWMSIQRGEVSVHCNLGSDIVRFSIPKGSTIVMASRDGIAAEGSFLELPPDTVAIVKRRMRAASPYLAGE